MMPKSEKGLIAAQSVEILPMQMHHLDGVVQVHLASFPGFFLSFLGAQFLYLLYSEILATPGHVALVAVAENRVIGFVAGVKQQDSFYRSVIRNRLFAFAFASLGPILRRPSIIPRLIRALTYPNTAEKAAAQALLMSIAVAPDAWGAGIGQRLVSTFLSGMQAQSIYSVSLVTDRDNNERTNRFYQNLGFELVNSYVTREGRAMNEYLIKLTPNH